ncbi:hypothetical protein HDU97_005470 [Phlyctochytrium planicorne]|nr:hypothetical protein HDU97_005470 [Phlyctochytrium planicorne]
MGTRKPPAPLPPSFHLHQFPEEILQLIAGFLPKDSLSQWMRTSRCIGHNRNFTSILYRDLTEVYSLPPLERLEKYGEHVQGICLRLGNLADRQAMSTTFPRWVEQLRNLKKLCVMFKRAHGVGDNIDSICFFTLILINFIDHLPHPEKVNALVCFDCDGVQTTGIYPEFFEVFKRLTHLRDVSFSTITQDHLNFLRGCEHLERLHLVHSTGFTEENPFLSLCSSLPKLKYIRTTSMSIAENLLLVLCLPPNLTRVRINLDDASDDEQQLLADQLRDRFKDAVITVDEKEEEFWDFNGFAEGERDCRQLPEHMSIYFGHDGAFEEDSDEDSESSSDSDAGSDDP